MGKRVFLKPSLQSYIQWFKEIGDKIGGDTQYVDVMQYTRAPQEEADAMLEEKETMLTGDDFFSNEQNKIKMKNLNEFRASSKAFIGKVCDTIDNDILEDLKQGEGWYSMADKGDTRELFARIKDYMHERYCRPADLENAQQRFLQLKQNEHESLTRLGQRVKDLALELEMLGYPMTEAQKIHAFIRTINPKRFGNVIQRVKGKVDTMGHDKNTPTQYTLREVVKIADMIEHEEKSLEPQGSRPVQRYGEDREQKIVAAINKSDNRKRPMNSDQQNQGRDKRRIIECWNCNKKGHISKECRLPKRTDNKKSGKSSNETS